MIFFSRAVVVLFAFFSVSPSFGAEESWCDQWRRTRGVPLSNVSSSPSDFNALGPGAGIQGVVTYKFATVKGGSWFGSAFGVPMLLTRLEEKRLAPLGLWLKKQIPRWRKLPVNFDWADEATRGSVTSKKKFYNALHEALTCDVKEVQESARYLSRELKKKIVEASEYYHQVPDLKKRECEGGVDWEPRIMEVDEHVFGKTETGLRMASWVNALNGPAAKGYDHLPMHRHDLPWHAYLTFDADRTNTTYHAPPPIDGVPRPLFNVVNEDFVLVLMNGGVDHAIPSVSTTEIYGKPQRPRLSLSVDFAYSLEVKDKVVGHPGARFPSQPLRMLHLDQQHKGKGIWAKFMSVEEKHKKFKGYSPMTFDHLAWQTTDTSNTLWAGLVDMHILLPDLSSRSRGAPAEEL